MRRLAYIVAFGLAAALVGAIGVHLLFPARKPATTEIVKMWALGRRAVNAIDASGQAPDFGAIFADNELSRLPPRDVHGVPYMQWGDRARHETIVLATRGANGVWDSAFADLPDETVQAHSLALAAGLVEGLLGSAILAGGSAVYLPPGYDNLAVMKNGDDVMLFPDVFVLVHYIRRAAVTGDSAALSRLKTWQELSRDRSDRPFAWSPLTETSKAAALDSPAG